jgi:hypothetical protein
MMNEKTTQIGDDAPSNHSKNERQKKLKSSKSTS